MSAFKPGLVHALVTPFDAKQRVDYDIYAKLIEFHLRNGADALAVPMHQGESVSLTDVEKRSVISFALKQAGGRSPVIAHVSDAGTGLSASLAKSAEEAGAAAVIATTPYYWTPPPAMIVEHFAEIAHAVKIPLFVHNAPEDMGGVKVTAAMMLKLIERAENVAGLVDSGLDWQFMIELMTDAPRLRPDFQLLSGMEYLVSASAIGATGMFSSLAAIAPTRVRQVYDQCRADRLFEARAAQEDLAALRQEIKGYGVAGLKGAMREVGRGCGDPRPPLAALDDARREKLAGALAELTFMRREPRGWRD